MPTLQTIEKYQDGENVNENVLNRPIGQLEQNQIDINDAFENHIDQGVTPDPHPQYLTAEDIPDAPVLSVDGQTGDVDLSTSYETKRKNNLTATTDPTVADDDTLEYEPLSRWINTVSGEIFLCISAATGNANWQPATLTLDELGSAALSDASDFATAAQGAKADSALQTNTSEYNLPNTIHFTGRSDILPYVSTSDGIPIEVSNYIIKNIDGNVALSFMITPSYNLTSTNAYIFAIDVYYTSGTITWPTYVRWPANEAPALTPNTRNLFFFIRRDNTFAGSYLLEYDMV